MCGIVAVVDPTGTVAAAQIDTMRALMAHRGPDAGGTVIYPAPGFAVALGSQRLSILDLSPAGTMPMSSNDGQVSIVYNGEIYNHGELRADLERRGYRYRSRTDTETLLHAYEEFDVGCFVRMNGMFACAIYDARRRRLVVARDRSGVKPLYYAERDGGFVCASELKVLVKSGAVPAVIDPRALDLYLALGYVPAPYALIKGVRKLPAGAYAVFEDGRLKVERYWTPALATPAQSPPWEHTVEATRAVVSEAILRQMISDVPVGVMLSGGLDSSIIAAVARSAVAEPLHTFSIGFETSQASLEPIYNYDRDNARRVAQSLGTVHHEIIATDGPGLADTLRLLVAQLDEPVWEPSFLSIAMISTLAREHGVKVLLSGDGSDELFGGYPWHPALVRLEQVERLPGLRPLLALLAHGPGSLGAKARDLARKYRRSDLIKYHAQYDIFEAPLRAGLFGRSPADDPLDALVGPLFAQSGGASLPARFALAELALWVGEHFNQRLDRMAMAASVEGRVPFQDNAVIDLALAMTDADKLRGGKGKAPLRAAFAGAVPDFVLERPKRPFAAPATAWMQGALRPLVAEALAPESLARLPGIDPGLGASLRASFRGGLPPRQEQVWTLLNLVLWAEGLPKAAGQPVPSRGFDPARLSPLPTT